jgi:hypothetical protein
MKKILGFTFILFFWTHSFAGYVTTLQLSPYNLLFAKVTINNKEALALIDFGSFRSIELSSTLANELDIALTNSSSTVFHSDGKSYPLQTGIIDSFAMGNYSVKKVAIDVARGDIERISAWVNTKFDVVLGWGFFSKFNLLLDYKNLTIQWNEQAFDCNDYKYAFNYVAKNGVPIVEGITIDTLTANFLLDTGAPTSNIDSTITNQPVGSMTNRQVAIQGIPFDLLLRVKNLGRIRDSLGCKGVLGNTFLSSFTVCIDASRKKIYLK